MAYLSPLFDCKLVLKDMATTVVATIIRLKDGAVMARHSLPPKAAYVELRYASDGEYDYSIHYRIKHTSHLRDRTVLQARWPAAPLPVL